MRRRVLRRGRWLHGAEPLVAERERRGLVADVEALLEGLPDALFTALTQREWEADVVWAAADSADAAATAVCIEEEREEEEDTADKPEGPAAAGAHASFVDPARASLLLSDHLHPCSTWSPSMKHQISLCPSSG